MARAKALTVTHEDIMRLEGIAQALSDRDAVYRPNAAAVDYIAEQLGVRRRTVQEWIRRARPLSRSDEVADAFFSVYEKIANLLSERIEAAVYRTASQAGERDALKAALWLLPRVNPERYGDVPDDEDESEDLVVAEIPQEVFDSMTTEELEQLSGLQKAVEDAMAAAELLIKQVQGRVLAEEIAARQTH